MSDSKRVLQIAANASAPEPKLRVDYVSPDLLRPSPRNARLHSRKKIRQLSQSIKALKVIAPILVDEDFEILAGHARWAAAKFLGLREIPVVQIKYLSDAEKRAYRLADNRFSEKATWDNELLSIEIKELIATEIEIELTGFDTADIGIILTSPDDNEPDNDIPIPPPGPAVTRIGDLYQLGKHRVICGDARDPTAYKTLMAGDRAGLVVPFDEVPDQRGLVFGRMNPIDPRPALRCIDRTGRAEEQERHAVHPRVFGELAHLRVRFAGPGTARESRPQSVRRVARLCPLFRSAIRERQIEHGFSARLTSRCGRSIQGGAGFRESARVGRGGCATSLQGRGRAVREAGESVGVSIVGFAVALGSEKLFRAGQCFFRICRHCAGT